MKQHSKFSDYLSLILLLAMPISMGFAKGDNSNALVKPATLEFELFEGNNIRNWIGNNGQLVSHRPTGDAGLEWPAGSGKTAVFVSGIWVTGKVNHEIRSAAAEFTSEWTPGTIPYDTQLKQPLYDVAPDTPLHQIYVIHQGNTSDPSSPDFKREYASWPASHGAPARDGEFYTDLNQNGSRDAGESFEDFNLDGEYNPPDGLFTTGEDPPLFLGDHQAWWVMNDWSPETHQRLWSTPPLGLEAQVTVFNRTGDPVYENVQFHYVKLVNKGGEYLDSVYYSYWNDADVGSAIDDFVGCDTTLDIGYMYNGRPYDQDYGITAPAVGYCFLQGPVVASPGDSVSHHGEHFMGLKALGMTAHVKFTGSDPNFGDPENASEAFRIMQGLKGHYSQQWGGPYYEYLDPTKPTTPFLYPGDPVTRSGWTEYDDSSPGDRRNVTSSGPFTMAPWDDVNGNGLADFGEPGVQIIETALILEAGVDHLNAITRLKYTTAKVRADFALNFDTPRMTPPSVSATASDQEIVLNWYEGKDTYETAIIPGYEFEGYNVYQGETAKGPWTRLHTYDKINDIGQIVDDVLDEDGYMWTELVQNGKDEGLQHLVLFTEDSLNGNTPLVNNKLYHLAVSGYAYNGYMIPKTLESPKQVFSIRPRQTFLLAGVRDSLEIEETGDSDVDVTVEVLDPSKVTGLTYQLGFDYDSTQSMARWYITRRSLSFQDTAIRGEWTGYDSKGRLWLQNEKLYVDGLEVSLKSMSFSTPQVIHGWEQTVNVIPDSSWVASYPAVSPGGVDSLMLVDGDTLSITEFFYPSERWDIPDFTIREEIDQAWFDFVQVATHSIHRNPNYGSLGIWGDRVSDIPNVGGGSEELEFLQSDLELRFTEQGQKATKYQRRQTDTLITIPFEVWDIERNIQLSVAVKDNNGSGGIQDTSLDNWENTLDLDWVILFDRDYATYSDTIQPLTDNPYSGWVWQFMEGSLFSIGDVVRLHFINPIDPEVDVFQWSTSNLGTSYDEDALNQIQVFPNPYFGYHTDQTTASGPYVTFSNLPEGECTIRIYSLGGHLVKRMDHISGSYENWSLLNEHYHRVASGIYIVHIEVPDLGNRILKLAILQSE